MKKTSARVTVPLEGSVALRLEMILTLWPAHAAKYLIDLSKAEGKIANTHHKLAAEILTQLLTKRNDAKMNAVKGRVLECSQRKSTPQRWCSNLSPDSSGYTKSSSKR